MFAPNVKGMLIVSHFTLFNHRKINLYVCMCVCVCVKPCTCLDFVYEILLRKGEKMCLWPCPSFEGIDRKQKYGCTHVYPWYYVGVSGQLHVLATVHSGKYLSTH